MPHGRARPTLAALAAAVLLVTAGCASDPVRQVPAARYEVQRAERVVPDGLEEQRAVMADQRAETRAGLDGMMGGTQVLEAQSAQPWYTPLFDALDLVASLGGLLY